MLSTHQKFELFRYIFKHTQTTNRDIKLSMNDLYEVTNEWINYTNEADWIIKQLVLKKQMFADFIEQKRQ